MLSLLGCALLCRSPLCGAFKVVVWLLGNSSLYHPLLHKAAVQECSKGSSLRKSSCVVGIQVLWWCFVFLLIGVGVLVWYVSSPKRKKTPKNNQNNTTTTQTQKTTTNTEQHTNQESSIGFFISVLDDAFA